MLRLKSLRPNDFDERLATKVLILRILCLILGILWIGLLVNLALSGEMVVMTSRTGGRFASNTHSQTLRWEESPVGFAFQLVGLSLIGLAMIAAIYAVLARIVKAMHRR